MAKNQEKNWINNITESVLLVLLGTLLVVTSSFMWPISVQNNQEVVAIYIFLGGLSFILIGILKVFIALIRRLVFGNTSYWSK